MRPISNYINYQQPLPALPLFFIPNLLLLPSYFPFTPSPSIPPPPSLPSTSPSRPHVVKTFNFIFIIFSHFLHFRFNPFLSRISILSANHQRIILLSISLNYSLYVICLSLRFHYGPISIEWHYKASLFYTWLVCRMFAMGIWYIIALGEMHIGVYSLFLYYFCI